MQGVHSEKSLKSQRVKQSVVLDPHSSQYTRLAILQYISFNDTSLLYNIYYRISAIPSIIFNHLALVNTQTISMTLLRLYTWYYQIGSGKCKWIAFYDELYHGNTVIYVCMHVIFLMQ